MRALHCMYDIIITQCKGKQNCYMIVNICYIYIHLFIMKYTRYTILHNEYFTLNLVEFLLRTERAFIYRTITIIFTHNLYGGIVVIGYFKRISVAHRESN